jgi:phosphate:Na+ symporter
MTLGAFGSFLGGVGLFLLGMRLMTDGLKLAAGPALRHILGQWTRTPLRGLFSGVLITSLVQSSSAVTVATIGFVNAGLLTLAQSIGVIYGSNIGTTMTGWLVALVGFNVDVKALALPLIGIGVGLHFTGAHTRRGALGEAFTGFGLFFLGVDVLKNAFADVGQGMPIDQLAMQGWTGALLFVGIGFVLTLLMQSSSAAMALILTATAGGVVPLSVAAAAVIGANLGTTSTAAIAVIGATPNAKRVAGAHVLFNGLTGGVAFLILPMMLLAVDYSGDLLGLEESPAVTLALFHTAFNILGVLLMWPLTRRLVHLLERRFRTSEEDLSRPQYLDKNVLATPTLALDAVALELARVGVIAREMGTSVLNAERVTGAHLVGDKQAVLSLVEAVRSFIVAMQRTHLPHEFDESLPDVMRVARYFTAVAELSDAVATLQERASYLEDEALTSQMVFFRGDAVKLLAAADPQGADYDAGAVSRQHAALEDDYQSLKAHLLRAGTEERISSEQMVEQLEIYSRLRRLLQQAVKGSSYLHGLLDLAAKYRRMQQEDVQAQT